MKFISHFRNMCFLKVCSGRYKKDSQRVLGRLETRTQGVWKVFSLTIRKRFGTTPVVSLLKKTLKFVHYRRR